MSLAVVICSSCGKEIEREPLGFRCLCGFGFAVQWDRSLGFGRFTGLIQLPLSKEVAK